MTDSKRTNLINRIQDFLEDTPCSEWESGFLEDISKLLSNQKDLSSKQMDRLLEIIGCQGG